METGTTASDFYAQEGDWPPARIVPFVRFVMRDARKTFAGLRVARTLNGVHVTAEAESQNFSGVWPVTLSGLTRVRIGDGTVNGRTPWLDGRGLDGLDEDDEPHPEGVPTLSVAEGHGDRRRSYVGVLVKVLEKTGAMDEKDPEALTVAHRPSLHAAFAEGGAPDEEGTGFWPLAQLQWSSDGKRVERVRQWAYFPYTHRFQSGDGGRPGRHWFRPA